MSTYKATELIRQAFDRKGIKYEVHLKDKGFKTIEEVEANYPVDNGPLVYVSFFSSDNDNDVSVRVMGLACNVSRDRRLRALEACNRLNNRFRFVKFCLDKHNMLDLEVDVPTETPDEALGKVAVELFLRIGKILDEAYQEIGEALFGPVEDEEEQKEAEEPDIMELLHRFVDSLPDDRDVPLEDMDADAPQDETVYEVPEEPELAEDDDPDAPLPDLEALLAALEDEGAAPEAEDVPAQASEG